MSLHNIPKSLRDKIDRIEREDGLIDNYKYMVYLKPNYELYEVGTSFPIRTKKELIGFDGSIFKLGDTTIKTDDEKRKDYHYKLLRSSASDKQVDLLMGIRDRTGVEATDLTHKGIYKFIGANRRLTR